MVSIFTGARRRMKGLWSVLSNENNARAIGLLLVGLPVGWAALTYVAERAWPEPEPVVIVRARDFVRGNNGSTGPKHAGGEFIIAQLARIFVAF
jgi:hypothetical protein